MAREANILAYNDVFLLIGVLSLLVLGLFAVAAPQAASAQGAVYRCGADGRSYSQQPCADGRTLRIDDDARVAAMLDRADGAYVGNDAGEHYPCLCLTRS